MEKISMELLSRLDLLAQKLGTTGEHLWNVLVTQARYSAIVHSFCLIVGIIIGFILNYYRLKEHKQNEDSETYYAYSIILIVYSVVYLGIFLGQIESTIAGFINPEYWALGKILSNIK